MLYVESVFWNIEYTIKKVGDLFFGSFVYNNCSHGTSGYEYGYIAERVTTDLICTLTTQDIYEAQHDNSSL